MSSGGATLAVALPFKSRRRMEHTRTRTITKPMSIQNLEEISSKLHERLESFGLYDTGVARVKEFARFVYSNSPHEYGNNVDAMRNHAARYIVSALGQTGEQEVLKELLEEIVTFVTNMWNLI
jgi:hypothetical protein